MPNFGAWPIAGVETTTTSDTAKVNTVVTPKHKIGSVHPDVNGGLWMYVNSTVALIEGKWVQIPSLASTGLCALMTTGNTTLGRMPVGVAGGTVAADDYGWVQIFGHNTHVGMTADTETTAAETGRVLFVSGTAGLATSDTAVPDLIYGAYTSEASATTDTGLPKYIGADLVFPYVTAGATTIA